MDASWKSSNPLSLEDSASTTRPILARGPSVYQGAEDKVIAEVCQPFESYNGRGMGGVHVSCSRDYTTIDSRIPTMPGQSTSGFHRPGRHHMHQGGGWVGGGLSFCCVP